MSQRAELKDRVEAKKKMLEAKIHELKADARSTSREESEKLQAKLDDLGESLQQSWEDMSEAVAGKLNKWLKDD